MCHIPEYNFRFHLSRRWEQMKPTRTSRWVKERKRRRRLELRPLLLSPHGSCIDRSCNDINYQGGLVTKNPISQLHRNEDLIAHPPNLDPHPIPYHPRAATPHQSSASNSRSRVIKSTFALTLFSNSLPCPSTNSIASPRERNLA